MATYIFEYRFVKWEEFNPPLKHKRAEPTWCRLDQSIFEHPALSGQSVHKQNLFIYMLSRAIRRSGYGQSTGKAIYLQCNLKQLDVRAYAAHLYSLGIIEYNFREVSKKVLDGRLTDKTDKTDNYEGVTDVPDPSSQNPKRKAKPKTEKPAKEESGSTMELWKAYTEVWRERYGNDPKRNAMTMGQAKQLVSRLGIEDAKQVVRFYLQQDDRYYEQQAYTLGPCLKNCEALLAKLQAETPKVITPEMYEAMGYKIIDTSQFPEEQELF